MVLYNLDSRSGSKYCYDAASWGYPFPTVVSVGPRNHKFSVACVYNTAFLSYFNKEKQHVNQTTCHTLVHPCYEKHLYRCILARTSFSMIFQDAVVLVKYFKKHI